MTILRTSPAPTRNDSRARAGSNRQESARHRRARVKHMAQKSVELTQTRRPLCRSLARWAWVPLVLAVCVSTSGSALAVVPEVKDGAGFFTPDALTKADR